MRDMTGHDEIVFLTESGPTHRLFRLVESFSDQPTNILKNLPLAKWEKQLLDLRILMLGTSIEAQVGCPNCEEDVMLKFNVSDFLSHSLQEDAQKSAEHSMIVDDVLAVESSGKSGAEALAILLARVLNIDEKAAEQKLTSEKSEEYIAQIEARTVGLDLDLSTECAACNLSFVVPFDVTSFFDRELRQRAETLLDEIHVLASFYHWSESDILSLPRSRRSAYLMRLENNRLRETYDLDAG